jgi:hypothetical protein
MPLRLSVLIAESARLQVYTVRNYLDTAIHVNANRLGTLKERVSESSDWDYVDHLSDEAAWLDEILFLSEQLAIVALYRVVESRTQLITDHWAKARNLSKKKRSGLYAINVLDAELLKVGIDRKTFSGYSTVEALRHANNAVKHEEGKVSPALSAYVGWNLGARIRLSSGWLATCEQAIPEYVQDLAVSLGV